MSWGRNPLVSSGRVPHPLDSNLAFRVVWKRSLVFVGLFFVGLFVCKRDLQRDLQKEHRFPMKEEGCSRICEMPYFVGLFFVGLFFLQRRPQKRSTKNTYGSDKRDILPSIYM